MFLVVGSANASRPSDETSSLFVVLGLFETEVMDSGSKFSALLLIKNKFLPTIDTLADVKNVFDKRL